MRRVAIVQPYVPTYRVPLFEALVDAAERDDITVDVIAGAATGAQAARRDGVGRAAWLREVPLRQLRVWGRSVDVSRTRGYWRDHDAVILPLKGTSIDVWEALEQQRRNGVRVGLWGHIMAYTQRPSSVDMWLERHQMLAASHVFAYTDRGRDFALECGVAPGRVTSLRNTVDLEPLRASIANTTPEQIQEFRRSLGVAPESPVFAFIGGIDASKRVDFLAEALDVLWIRRPDARVVVGGRGTQEHLLDAAERRGQVARIGYVGPREKALIAHASSAILNPGRIGLVAVEAIEMGLPIITTDWEYHAPEFEYLREGRDVVVTSSSPIAFIDAAFAAASREDGLERDPAPSIGDMVNRFHLGIQQLLADR